MSATEPNITWRFTWPEEPPQHDFAALDGEKIVGRVYQYPHGPKRACGSGRWWLRYPVLAFRGGPAASRKSAALQAGAWSRRTTPYWRTWGRRKALIGAEAIRQCGNRREHKPLRVLKEGRTGWQSTEGRGNVTSALRSCRGADR